MSEPLKRFFNPITHPRSPTLTQAETTSGRPYQGRTAQERRAERRERLIRAAIRLYGTRGFRATTIKDVCDEAGVTQRYFYEAFASAEELLCAATGEVTTAIRSEVLSAAQDAPGHYEGLHGAALAYFSH
ncbi:TetR/AcrR family transcriptional regulator, partial [Deinococcus sp.]|uniref:TetR/AcrR family transcriptional regulator n=1 Tax=Deinococcus sp. TaxID=47478 RepID=UPI0025C693B4